MPVEAVGSTSISNSNARSVSSSFRPAPTFEAARQGNYIQRGQEGASVRDLQRQLNASGAQPPLAEDGQFGPKTEAAVKRFQSSAGLQVDGVVGPRTLQALQNGSSVEGEQTRRNRTSASASTGSNSTTAAPTDAPRSNRTVNTTRGLSEAPAADASNRAKLDYAAQHARDLGLTITSTTGGRHAPNSYHYSGRAIDVAGPASAMAQFYRDMRGSNPTEMFYDPIGGVKHGRNIGAIGGHSDHVHIAY